MQELVAGRVPQLHRILADSGQARAIGAVGHPIMSLERLHELSADGVPQPPRRDVGAGQAGALRAERQRSIRVGLSLEGVQLWMKDALQIVPLPAPELRVALRQQ